MNQNSPGSSIEPINRTGSRKRHLALSRFAAGLFSLRTGSPSAHASVKGRLALRLLHLLTHPELLQLAGHRHRELLDEADVGRHLEVRDLPLAGYLGSE